MVTNYSARQITCIYKEGQYILGVPELAILVRDASLEHAFDTIQQKISNVEEQFALQGIKLPPANIDSVINSALGEKNSWRFQLKRILCAGLIAFALVYGAILGFKFGFDHFSTKSLKLTWDRIDQKLEKYAHSDYDLTPEKQKKMQNNFEKILSRFNFFVTPFQQLFATNEPS